MLQHDNIVKVGIDERGSLCIEAATSTFPYIWRAGMEVGWDPQRGVLYSPVPRQWSYARWFRQITLAAEGEHGVLLHLTPETVWQNVPPDVRTEIEAIAASHAKSPQ